MSDLLMLIVQIAVIIALSRAIVVLFDKVHQPKVIGEMFAGIMLGPSLLGWLAPHVSARLFPTASMNDLFALSQVGVMIYMFLVGLSVNPKGLKGRGHAAVLTSHVSIIAPFVLGAGLAFVLYPRLSDDSVSFTSFALFMGAAMSITAFPVLARILTDREVLGTRLGSLAIACAAVDDVTGWCILAYIVVLVHTHQPGAMPLWMTLGGLLVFVFGMIYGVKRLLGGFEASFKRHGRLSENVIALMVLVVLACAMLTERLGLHALFGAFLAGAIMPKDREFVRYVVDRLESATVVLLLPLFFAYTGLRTSIRLIQGPTMWLFTAAIIGVAVVGKLGGSMIAARSVGARWREAAGVGILMNTRGLMELVILNIGLDIGVISQTLFSMMVIMALVTTFMTTPLLEWVYPLRMMREDTVEWEDTEPVHEVV